MKRNLAVTFAAIAVLVSGVAQARGEPDSITDTSGKIRAQNLSVLAYLPWYYGFGIGANVRYEIPVVQNGFVPSINNSVSVEPSLGLAYSSWGPAGYSYSIFNITPAVYGLWNFYFNPKFSAYGGLGLGFNVGVISGSHLSTFNANYFYWDPVVGLHYKLSPGMALRAEAGAQGLKGGLSFYF